MEKHSDLYSELNRVLDSNTRDIHICNRDSTEKSLPNSQLKFEHLTRDEFHVMTISTRPSLLWYYQKKNKRDKGWLCVWAVFQVNVLKSRRRRFPPEHPVYRRNDIGRVLSATELSRDNIDYRRDSFARRSPRPREESLLTRLIRWERHSDGWCQKVGYSGSQLIFFSVRREGRRRYVTQQRRE